MKTFLGVVALSVGAGLALRYALHRHDHKDQPVVSHDLPPITDEPPVAVPPPTPTPPTPEPTPTPPPPEPPRIAGSKLVTSYTTQHFGVGPGVIYYCDGSSVWAQPKSGDPAKIVGECDQSFDFVADAQGAMYCSNKQIMRITAGTEGSHVVAEVADCIMGAVDAKYAYFVVPGFEGIPNPGVYRVARAGGTPEKIHATTPKEQYILAVDDDALWIGGWGYGTISKLAKTPNAKAQTVISDQKGIVSLATTPTHLYWYSENSTEVRRRKKTGGKIEVVGHDIDQEPVTSVDGHVYWFERGDGATKRLVHLAPGAAKPETLASDLQSPSMRVDAEGVYVTELDRPGIFMFAR